MRSTKLLNASTLTVSSLSLNLATKARQELLYTSWRRLGYMVMIADKALVAARLTFQLVSSSSLYPSSDSLRVNQIKMSPMSFWTPGTKSC